LGVASRYVRVSQASRLNGHSKWLR